MNLVGLSRAVIVGTAIWQVLASDAAEQALLNATISVSKNTVVVGEPVIVSLRIRNVSEEDRLLYRWRREVGYVWLSRDGVHFEDYVSNPNAVVLGPTKLLPAEESIQIHRVLYAISASPVGGKYAFPQPGSYFIQGGYEDSRGISIRSDIAQITVKEPAGEDMDAWATLRTNEDYGVLVQFDGQVGVSPQSALLMERIVTDHPQTVYAHYLALTLGKYWLSYGRQVVGQPNSPVTPPEAKAKAAQYIQTAANMTQVTTVREEGMLEWAKLLGGNKAIEICEQALQAYPNGWHKREFEELRRVWVDEEAYQRSKPKDVITQVEQELVAMGYDLAHLSETNRYRINNEVIGSTWQDCERLNLSNADCDAELNRRYRAWAAQNLVPVNRPADTTPPEITCPAAMALGCDVSLEPVMHFGGSRFR